MPSCSNLKEELRMLRDEARGVASALSRSGAQQDMGMVHSTTGSSTFVDDDDGAPSTNASYLCTPEKKPAPREGPKQGPSVQQNRFHRISEEGCESLRQADLKKAAKSPSMLGAPGAASAHGTGSNSATLQKYSHILVIDFECTCDSGEPNYPHEIIEFPVVAIDTATLQTVAEFHTYVKPVRNPTLSEFCTGLTGITQAHVQDAPTMPKVLAMFDEWLREALVPIIAKAALMKRLVMSDPDAALLPEADLAELLAKEAATLYQQLQEPATASSPASSFPLIVATDGPTDMRHFMYNCHVIRDGVDFPPLFYRWLNIRRAFADHFRVKPHPLTKMLHRLGMQFHGQHHSGIDDARNIARIAVALIQRGHRLQHVSGIPFLSETLLDAERRASDLLLELGSDCDIGITRQRTVPQAKAKQGKGKKTAKR